MTTYNINNFVYVQLTPAGLNELERQHNQHKDEPIWLNDDANKWPIEQDENGWSRWQMYQLLEKLGHMLSEFESLPFNPNIKLDINGDEQP